MLSEINQTQKEGLSDPTHRRSLNSLVFTCLLTAENGYESCEALESATQ